MLKSLLSVGHSVYEVMLSQGFSRRIVGVFLRLPEEKKVKPRGPNASTAAQHTGAQWEKAAGLSTVRDREVEQDWKDCFPLAEHPEERQKPRAEIMSGEREDERLGLLVYETQCLFAKASLPPADPASAKSSSRSGYIC
jgi:hypothetical protein